MGSALRIAEGQVKCGALAARIAKGKGSSRYANRGGQERVNALAAAEVGQQLFHIGGNGSGELKAFSGRRVREAQ